MNVNSALPVYKVFNGRGGDVRDGGMLILGCKSGMTRKVSKDFVQPFQKVSYTWRNVLGRVAAEKKEDRRSWRSCPAPCAKMMLSFPAMHMEMLGRAGLGFLKLTC